MIDALIQARDDIRAVLSETRPDLVSEFNANAGGADDPRWVSRFLDEHFPDQGWALVQIQDTARLLRQITSTRNDKEARR